VDAEEKVALAGTWRNEFYILTRQASEWQTEAKYELASDGGYCLTHSPSLQMVMLVGTNPSDLFLVDLQTFSLYQLSDLGLNLFWAKDLGKNSFIAAGENALLRYSFTRGDTGITYEVSSRLSTDLGTVYVIEKLTDGNTIALGNARGEVVLLSLNQEFFTPLGENLSLCLLDAEQ
jgi:hypothetical protein